MTARSTSLTIAQDAEVLPAGAYSESYEVMADTPATYEIDAAGVLVRKDRIDATRWVSPDFTGSFSISSIPKYAQSIDAYVVFVVCGVVKHMHSIDRSIHSVLKAAEWRWTLEALNVDRSAILAANSYQGCLRLLQESEDDPGLKTNDNRLDAMIGMAHCRPALLPRNSARNALECLEDHQLRAVISWHRANLSN